MTSDGEIYATKRFDQIVKERYEISKRINTSYEDTGKITVKERALILQFIEEDIKHDNKVIEQAQQKAKTAKKH